MPSVAAKKPLPKAKPPRKRVPVRHEKTAPPWSFVMDLGLSKKQLAETVGLRPEALYKTRRASAAKTATRLAEMAEILTRVADWAGGRAQAVAWYRGEPIPAFGDRTAESLVKSGQAAALRDYLDSLALGGFA
jgi:uncharacterized protein (DUF2384 family)